MNEAISKAQYALKAKIFYFLFSKLNILILVCVYVFSDSVFPCVKSKSFRV